METELVAQPGISVMTRDGRTAVVYDPHPGTADGRARQVHFAIEGDDLVFGQTASAVASALPVAEIEGLAVAARDAGGYALMAGLTDGDEVELLGGIPYQQSAVTLARALGREFDLHFQPPEFVPDETSHQTVAAAGEHIVLSPTYPPRSFISKARPWGRVFLVSLAILGLLDLGSLLFTIIATELPALYNDVARLDIVTSFALGPVWMVVIVMFLVWIYRVHQDLNALSPTYEISPWGAVARVGIPLFNIWGLWAVMRKMADRLSPDLNIVGRISYGLFTVSLLDFGFDRLGGAWPQVILGLISLATTMTWFIFTRITQKELAAREQPQGSARIERQGADMPHGSDSSLAGKGQNSQGHHAASGRKMSRRLKIGIAVLALLAVGFLTLGAVYGPRAIQGFLAFQKEWYDESFGQLNDVLWARWGPDDSIPSASADIQYLASSAGPSEVWLVINLGTTTRCTLTVRDPCKSLANEFGGIVLENYARVDELNGLHVIVTYVGSAGAAEAARSVEVRQSIPWWRRELGNLALGDA